MLIITLLFLRGGLAAAPTGTGPGVPFSFNLSVDAKTSAGVYTKDGVLIRTLWSGVSYKAGSYAMNWDGKDDDGHLATGGPYDIKVLSNNVTASWEGVVGNTSNLFVGPTVHRGWEPIRTMTANGNFVYYGKGAGEGSSSQGKFLVTAQQSKIGILPSVGTSQCSLFSTTDGKNVYWSGYDAFADDYDGSWFIFATTVATDSEYMFAKGVSLKVTKGYTYKSAIQTPNASVSGLAVQKTGNYLFVAQQDKSIIRVFNKTTGEAIRRISILSPGNICVDKDDNLWVISGKNKVQRYTVKADGSLSASTLTIAGLTNALAVAVSPVNGMVIVADGGQSQQLKAFNSTTGASIWTYGQAGGYTTNATVANDKFYFTDEVGIYTSTFICFQADGSFWVGDTGNSRAMHYSSSLAYMDCVMYVPVSYSTVVDPNNPSRVFSKFLEFEVDYSKPLGGTNGSWKLVRNWGATVPANYLNQFSILKGVATLSNGRTYATLNNATTSAIELVELVNNGLLRLTGVVVSPKAEGATTQLYPDGSLRRTYRTAVGQAQKFTRKPLTGFDGANNPLWGSETTLATTPLTTSDDPLYYGNQIKLRAGEVTASNVVVAFDGSKASTKYHLGASACRTTSGCGARLSTPTGPTRGLTRPMARMMWATG
ncbi:FlgD immunoglobulin-like domain containing protein [Spirosoma sp. KNUC1025]|uniref:FlgD immunoglobulin-like domain containing protein n=1 Tax=Spirosoma sp. KNUC1025 TaxID=2894082 RepID=UPI0038651845|nr:hypothetical protein LN737_22275 [Spirosoma sp. KNUC1025]